MDVQPPGDGEDKTIEASASRKSCFLCGAADHELPTCPHFPKCVILCRDWGHGKPQGGSVPPALNKAVWSALNGAGLTVKWSHWHRGVCYVQLGSEQEAQQLIKETGPKGLIVNGEVLRVRPARSSRSQSHSKEERWEIWLRTHVKVRL